MKPDDATRIMHMIESAEEALLFCKGKSYDDFRSDRMLANATVRSLEILGEAAAQLSKEFREQYSGIEWRDIVAMRNVLIHAYFDINYQVVWQAIQNDIPALLEKIKPLANYK